MTRARQSGIGFIGCAPRSGSTLLTRILDSHSRIASPCEIALPQYFAGDSEKESLVNEKFRQICKYYDLDPDAARARPDTLFDSIRRREQKEFLILKDPRQSLFFARIVADYPSAKFVLLVRDARAVASSIMFAHQPVFGFMRWYQYTASVLKAVENLGPDQRYVIRYEDLIADPACTTGALAEFLGYAFEPPMLNYGDFEHADDKMNLWSDGPPDTSPLHKRLTAGKLASDGNVRAGRFNETLLDIYNRMTEIRALNRFFQYSDSQT
jgi:hypothetical protein